MTSPAEVKKTFKTLIEDNSTVVQQLQTTLAETKDNRRAVETQYAVSLSEFVASFLIPNIDEEALSLFTKLNGGGQDLGQAFKARLEDSKQAEAELTQLTSKNGPLETVEAAAAQSASDLNDVQGRQTRAERDFATYNQRLAEIDKFNEEALKDKKEEILPGMIDKFMGANMFARHLHAGRKLIEKYEQQYNEKITDAFENRNTAGQQQVDLQLDVDLAVVAQKSNSEQSSQMRRVSERIIDEAQAKTDLSAKILGMFSDKTFLDAAAKELGDKFPADLAESCTKIDAFKNIEAGLNLRIGSIQQVSGKLEEAIPKMDKAVAKGQGTVNVNLDDVTKQVKSQQVIAVHDAVETDRASKAIKNFSAKTSSYHSHLSSSSSLSSSFGNSSGFGNYGYGNYGYGNSPFDFYQNMMIYDMMFDNNNNGNNMCVDPYVVNNYFGVSDDLAGQCNIDTNNLSPQFSPDMAGNMNDIWGGSGNSFDPSTQNFDFTAVQSDAANGSFNFDNNDQQYTEMDGGQSSSSDPGFAVS